MGTTRVAGYVLAGGKSSRMGQDKAMLEFQGQTLLRRAVSTMRGVTSEVAVLGERSELEGADRTVADRRRGCGPLGGMEAALNDLVTNERLNAYEWACFLPVDMPLLPAGLYKALVGNWLEAATDHLRIAYVVADGIPQPLVSLLHRSMLPHLTEALELGNYKVTSVLRGSAASADFHNNSRAKFDISETERLRVTVIHTLSASDMTDLSSIGWCSTKAEESTRRLWFSNINTPEQLKAVDTLDRNL